MVCYLVSMMVRMMAHRMEYLMDISWVPQMGLMLDVMMAYHLVSCWALAM